MNLKEMVQFVKVDEAFYTVLKEYEKTGNTKIVLEKIFENLFTDFKSIATLTNNFKDKKALDFFIGVKNAEVFKNLQARTEQVDSPYELSDFMVSTIFESTYSNSRLHAILYEIQHLEEGTRQATRYQVVNKEIASHINKAITKRFERNIKDKSFKYSSAKLKWIELFKMSLNNETKLELLKMVLKEAQTLIKDTDKNYSKLIILRDFLSLGFLNSFVEDMSEELKFEITSLFFLIVKHINDKKGNSFGTGERKYGEKSLMNLLTALYTKNVPDNVYELIFAPMFIDGIPPKPYNDGYRDKNEDFIWSNFHLVSDRKVFEDYVKKSFEESFEFLEYYKESYHDIKKLDVSGLKRSEVKETYKSIKPLFKDKFNIGDFNHGMPLIFRMQYPLYISNVSVVDMFFDMYGEKADKHFKEILSCDLSNIEILIAQSRDIPLSARLMMAVNIKNDCQKEDMNSMLNYVENILTTENLNMFDDIQKDKLYKFYFNHNFLFEYGEDDKSYSRKPIGINSEVKDIAMAYKEFNEKKFYLVISRDMSYQVEELSRELFKEYFPNDEDLKEYSDTASKYFIYDKKSFHKIVNLMDKNYSANFMQNTISKSSKFIGEVLEELLEMSKDNLRYVQEILKNVFNNCPENVPTVRDFNYEDEEIRDTIFNAIMEKFQKEQDPKALPHIVQAMNNDKRVEALSILEKALKNLFPNIQG